MSDGARKPGEPEFEVPELDLAYSQQTRKLESGGAPRVSTAPLGQPSPTPAPAAAPVVPSAPVPPSYGKEFEFDDDMVIDRNIVPDPLGAGGRPIMPMGIQKGSGLELGANLVSDDRLSTRSHDKVIPRTDYAGIVTSTILSLLFCAGAVVALFRFVHRHGGWNIVPLAQRAFDGGSALWSGGAGMTALALCITLTIMSMYAKPRSLGYGMAALAMLIIAITLIIIAFSVGPDGAPEVPPDGAKLIPWALPFVLVGVAFRFLRNGWDKCFERSRFLGVLLAAVSGAVVFAAVELGFGAGLSRFL